MLTSKHQSRSVLLKNLSSFISLMAVWQSSLNVMAKKRFYDRDKLVHTFTKSLHVCTRTNNNLEILLEVIPMFSCKMKHQDMDFNVQKKFQGTYMNKNIALCKLTCRNVLKNTHIHFCWRTLTWKRKHLSFSIKNHPVPRHNPRHH